METRRIGCFSTPIIEVRKIQKRSGEICIYTAGTRKTQDPVKLNHSEDYKKSRVRIRRRIYDPVRYRHGGK